MIITVRRAHDPNEHIGQRYLTWCYFEEYKLTPAQKAEAHEKFAAEFEALSPNREPCEGWSETMAYLSRRIARRLRGEPVGEWVPRRDRISGVP